MTQRCCPFLFPTFDYAKAERRLSEVEAFLAEPTPLPERSRGHFLFCTLNWIFECPDEVEQGGLIICFCFCPRLRSDIDCVWLFLASTTLSLLSSIDRKSHSALSVTKRAQSTITLPRNCIPITGLFFDLETHVFASNVVFSSGL